MAAVSASQSPDDELIQKTVLNHVHHSLGAKMAPFAGWEMPVQYPAGILAEHRAVRAAAGLFDVSHMTVLEVAGPGCDSFLDVLLTNTAGRLKPGQAHYSFMLYPDGAPLDDLFVFRLERDRFLLVVNAANSSRDFDWIQSVNSRSVSIDRDDPTHHAPGPVEFCSLRNADADSLVLLALQGPKSLDALTALEGSPEDLAALRKLGRNEIVRVTLGDIPLLVSRTGYTGAKVGFELFVHPGNAVYLWEMLLSAGSSLGVAPAGLGARDSTRVEAGLPLFGHDLDGPLAIAPDQAGYPFIVKLDKPFFIGRSALARHFNHQHHHVIRLTGQGRKSLRPGHVILNAAGTPVGEVTSFAYVHPDMTFIVLACVNKDCSPEPGESITGARIHADSAAGKLDEREFVPLTALTRFPTDSERDSWPTRYA